MRINRLLDEMTDHEFDRMQFLQKNLIKGVVIPSQYIEAVLDKQILEFNPMFLAGEFCSYNVNKVCKSEIFCFDKSIYTTVANDVAKLNGIASIWNLFYNHDQIECRLDVSTGNLSLKVVKKKSANSDSLGTDLNLEAKDEHYQDVIDAVVYKLKGDLVSYEDHRQDDEWRISSFTRDLYQRQGRISKELFDQNNDSVVCNLDQIKNITEGTRRLLNEFSTNFQKSNYSVQFLMHVFDEEIPLSEDHVSAYYQNGFRKTCHILGIDFNEIE